MITYRVPISEDIDINHVNHFLQWVIIGMLIPNKWILAILLMILWEAFEYMIVYTDPFYILTKEIWPVPERYWNETQYNKIVDMVVNMIGYGLGSILRTFIICKK